MISLSCVTSSCESVRVLLQAWRRSKWRELARRRPAVAHLREGADEWAAGRLLRAGRPVVLAGGVITECVARRWCGRPPLCPHSGLEDEDAEHRHWRCPAWAAARADALGSHGAATQLRR